MGSLVEYYHHAKGGFANIDPKDMAQLGEDWMVTAATGAGVGLISAAFGGLDKKVAGFPVPLDGLISVGLGFTGLSMKGDVGRALTIASIAAGGSAAVRTFETFFKRGFKVKGEFEDLGGGLGWQLGMGGVPFHGQQPLVGAGVGFGQADQDRLVAAARYL
jgi:hypothetical protein